MTGWHNDEATDHPALMADHARNGPICGVEHQRPKARTIGSNTSSWPRPMNRDVHRIVPKRPGQNLQEFTTRRWIGISNGFVYHLQIMLTATNRQRR
jgi:hypothetical protein